MKLGEFIHKLLGGRDYKDIDGVPCIREGFGDWERLDTHLKREHPELWDEIIEQERKKEKGQALIFVLILLMVAMLVITSSLFLIVTTLKTNKIYKANTVSLYSAEAGIQDGIWNIINKTSADLIPFFTPNTYDDYDYTTTWDYSLGSPINGYNVDIQDSNMWIPLVSTPSSTDAKNIINNTNLAITGSSSSLSVYVMNISYNDTIPSTPLTVLTISCWLPQGYTYNNMSSNLTTLFPATKENLVKCGGNEAVVWTLPSGTTFTNLLAKLPYTGNTISITFTYTSSIQKFMQALSWITITPNTIFPYNYTWDANTNVSDIIATAGNTEIEAYIPKSETRILGTALAGDYVAVGNSLMTMGTLKGIPQNQYNDPYGIRYSLLSDSSATVSNIPSDANIEKAYLYWSGWFSGNQASEPIGNQYGGLVSLQVNGHTVNSSLPYDTVQKRNNTPSGKGYSYSCFSDVTSLVKNELQAENPSATNITGNAIYDVGGASGCKLGDSAPQIQQSSGSIYEWAYAGWSMIIVYSSPETLGHQLYLYDTFSYADNNTDIDPTGITSGNGGTISGFITPPKDVGTQDTNPLGANYEPAATLTAFVGEGDWCYNGDSLELNSTKLSQIVLPNGNLFTIDPNNVWNSDYYTSISSLTDGVDIKTFPITWESNLLSQGATSAKIDLPTQTDSWNLVYMILSFRSSVTSGNSISYLIRRKSN